MTLPVHPTIDVTSEYAAEQELTALLKGVGVCLLHDVSWIRVYGTDRARWLNGMITNSVQDLKPGDGKYSFVLSAQGRIKGDAYVFSSKEELFLETSSDQKENLISLLNGFIIMDDVELTDISNTLFGLILVGPLAASLLVSLGISVGRLDELQFDEFLWNTFSVRIVRAYSPLVPRFEIWSTAEGRSSILKALHENGAVPCSAQSIDWLRILEGTPRYGTDILERDLPQETLQMRALHFSKGCYVGQEIVERIRSRGNVHRKFAAFRLEGSLPSSGTKLLFDSAQVGELTSVASIPCLLSTAGSVKLGLGYLRRGAISLDSKLLYEGGTAMPVLPPISLAEIC